MRIDVSREQIEKAFTRVKDDPVFEESAGIFARGKLPAEMIQAMCLRPDVLEAFAHLSRALYPGGIIEREVKELIILESSRANACQFCTSSHIAIIRMLGITDDPLALLDDPETLTDRQQVALEYTRAVMQDSNRVPDELFERVRALFGDEEIIELAMMVGYINMLNMFNNALRVTYRDDYAALSEAG